jgi:rhamnosyl/mannosyltransferase
VVNTALPTGVPFVSVDGMTGLTVPPRDAPALAAAIGRLLEDGALREWLGAGARARVEAEFTLQRMLDRVLDVYREALAAGAARCR